MSITERFVTGVDRAVIFSIACEIDDREGKEGDGDGMGLNPRGTPTARTEEEGASASPQLSGEWISDHRLSGC